MSFIRGGETITIKRRSAASVDEFGNKTFSTTTITVKDALVGIGTGDEPIDPTRNPSDYKVTLYLPNGTVIQDGDIFVVRGSQWQKDGGAMEWISPFTGFETGIVVPLRKRNG